MDSSTKPIIFTSRIYPEISVILNRASYRTRFAVERLSAQDGEPNEKATMAAWKAYVRDFDGITIDGKKPNVEGLLLDGPDDLVVEVIEEIKRISTRLVTTDAIDMMIVEDCDRQKAEALERIEKRKNSAPATSPAITGAGANNAGDASASPRKPGEPVESATVTA
ncbi:MAG TPA: hypothetical protein VI942_01705 [Thermoanaerobaculia bacterium]|nr:hypothetical protein [Thermoanaerobaculia bacterium]